MTSRRIDVYQRVTDQIVLAGIQLCQDWQNPARPRLWEDTDWKKPDRHEVDLTIAADGNRYRPRPSRFGRILGRIPSCTSSSLLSPSQSNTRHAHGLVS